MLILSAGTRPSCSICCYRNPSVQDEPRSSPIVSQRRRRQWLIGDSHVCGGYIRPLSFSSTLNNTLEHASSLAAHSTIFHFSSDTSRQDAENITYTYMDAGMGTRIYHDTCSSPHSLRNGSIYGSYAPTPHQRLLLMYRV